jgi:excinuclease UvrABC nuclease subunit
MQLKWSNIYRLNSENILKYTPKSAGVYMLWVQLGDGTRRNFYVGQATNLEQRLLAHLSVDEPNKGIKEHVSKYNCDYCTAEVATQSERDGIETFLYGRYKPQCNEIVPPGDKSIEVNLP